MDQGGMKPAWAIPLALCFLLWVVVLLEAGFPREPAREGIPAVLS